MSAAQPVPAVTGNRLLDLLPRDELERLWPLLQKVRTTVREQMVIAGVPSEYVWFPIAGMTSTVVRLEEGLTVEVGVIGKEGIIGLAIVLGAKISPHESFVQIAGSALRMHARELMDLLASAPVLHGVLLRYAHFSNIHSAQTAACNARHTIEQRLARWLLVTSDRIGQDDFALTHEFLSMMLAVRRSGVTVAAKTMQRTGIITYHHGQVSILDRSGLEDVSCECYRIVKDHQTLLFCDGVRPAVASDRSS